jgi:hypothetical protein
MSETNALLQKLGGVPTLTAGDQVLVNPLAATMAGNQAAQSVFQTRDWQAKQAAGQAYQQAIDPETGRFDPLKFNNLLAATGATGALAAKSGVESSQELQGAQLAQNAKMQSLLNDSVTAALASPDANLKQSVLEQAQRLRAAGFPSDRIDGSLLHLSSDPAQLRQQLETVRVGTLPPDQRQQVIYGQPFRQTGPSGATIGGVQDPRGGGVSGPGGQPGLPQGQDPSDLNRIVQIGTNPDGTKRMGTQRQAQNIASGRDANDDGPTPGSQLGTGRLPAPLLNPNKATPPPGTQPATTPTAKPPGFNVGQPPAQEAAQTETGGASAKKFQDIVAQGVNARSQDALLANLAGEAAKIRTGPGADFVNDLKRTILGVGAQFGTTFGIDADKLKSMEDVIKIGNQLANAQGAGSDARLKVNEGSNPSYHNTPLGLDFIVRQLRGNNDYTLARQKLAATYSDKSDIEGFESKAGANLDPRVFQYQRMAPGKMREDYFNTIAPADRPAFKKAYQWAEQNGAVGG